MADQKISQLNELTTWADDDEIAIVDTDLTETKRMVASNVKANAMAGMINLDRETVTIVAGVITITKSYVLINTEGGGSPDNLDTINRSGGNVDGDLLVIQPAGAPDVNVRDMTGNIDLDNVAGNFLMDTPRDTLTLLYSSNSARWVEISRSSN